MKDSIKGCIHQPSTRGGLLSSQYDNVPDLKLLNSSVIADYNEVRAEAFPLSRGGHYDAVMAYFKCGDPNYDPNKKSVQKVSLTSLLSYSSFGERWWMALGVVLVSLVFHLVLISYTFGSCLFINFANLINYGQTV